MPTPGSNATTAPRAWPRIFTALWLLGLTLAFVAPLRSADWPIGHGEGPRYLALGELLREAISARGWGARWLPTLGGGYGYPTFVYYQPLVFLLYVLWAPLLSITHAMLATVATTAFIGILGVYFLARVHGNRLWACGVATLFMLSPYVYVNAFVRQDLSELLSMMLVPWVFLGLEHIATSRSGSTARTWAVGLLASAFAAVICAHPIIGVLTPLAAAPVVASLCFSTPGGALFTRPTTQSTWTGASAVLGFAGGLALSAPYWLPFTLMKSEVALEGAHVGYYETARHTVHWLQLLKPTWGFGISTVDDAADGMPLQLGALHCGLAVAAAWFGRRHPRTVALTLSYSVFVVLITPAGARFWRLPLFDQMQFPWRAFAITTTLQVALIASAAPKLAGRLPRVPRVLLWSVTLLAVALWQRDQFSLGRRLTNANEVIGNEVAQASHRFLTYAGADEFRPKTILKRPAAPRGSASILTTKHGTISFSADSSDFIIDATVRVNRATFVQIQQHFLPGWVVTVDGEAVPESRLRKGLTPAGLMRIPLAPETPGRAQSFHVKAYYGSPRGETFGEGLALAAVAGWAAWLLRLLRNAGRARRVAFGRATPSPLREEVPTPELGTG